MHAYHAGVNGNRRSRKGRKTTEERVQSLIRAQLLPGETLLTNVRLSDPRHGDVEADVVVLIPDRGIAVVEVKGGAVKYSDGVWTCTNGTYRRRMNPVEQARRSKHALRRFLDRQPEWNHGLVRSAWFVALADTPVHGDLGPEGAREHLIGRDDLGSLMHRVRAVLGSSLNTDPLPPGDWVDEALSLILRTGVGREGSSATSRLKPRWFAIAALALLVAFGGIVLFRIAQGDKSPQPAPRNLGANCNPNYEPCLPVVEDLDCPEIRLVVKVVGSDVYDLDRDGDGRACESYELPSS